MYLVSRLSWQEVREALVVGPHGKVPGQRLFRHAAVAAILRESPSSDALADLLMIRRAEKDGDPWSGHMAFPGGRVEPGDEGPLAAAIRETHEEIHLDLEAHAEHLGRLSQQHAVARGRPIPLAISPFLFELQVETTFRPNHEVAEVVWIPLSFFLDDANRSTMMYRKMGVNWELPCYEFEGRTIWGLTLRMIDEMLERIRTLAPPA